MEQPENALLFVLPQESTGHSPLPMFGDSIRSRHPRLPRRPTGTFQPTGPVVVSPQIRTVRRESPGYPPDAVRANATGRTTVRVTLSAEGEVLDTEVVSASGQSKEHRLLDRTARDFFERFPELVRKTGQKYSVNVSWIWRLDQIDLVQHGASNDALLRWSQSNCVCPPLPKIIGA